MDHDKKRIEPHNLKIKTQNEFQKNPIRSLRHLTIEETYELGDAILENDLDEVKKELGDVLLHIVFYAKIGSETKHFDIADVCNSISDKLISRHPHIYGDVKVADEEEVKLIFPAVQIKSLSKPNVAVMPGFIVIVFEN